MLEHTQHHVYEAKPTHYGSSQMGVFFIFFINGIALQLVGGSAAEMTSVVQTNLLIQTYNFGFIPLLVALLAPFYPDAVFR